MKNLRQWEGKRATVFGAGVSGLALAELAKDLGMEVFVTEQRPLEEGARERLRSRGIGFEEGGHTPRVFETDLFLLGSGIAPRVPQIQQALSQGVEVMGELDFVSPFLRGSLLGVTGSNGKTTTTSLIGHLLREEGVRVSVAGNIGNPLASAVREEAEWVVAELSSFQLHWARRLRCSLAVVTNLAPDHIDWHGSYEAYVDAKANLVRALDPTTGMAIVQRSELPLLPPVSQTIPLSWTECGEGEDGGVTLIRSRREALLSFPGLGKRRLFSFDALSLLGDHNLENAAMAATATTLVLKDAPKHVEEALTRFVAPPHRCQLVRELGKVRFVDDSKGTNVAATMTALTSLPGTKVILLGGQGKGESYGSLAKAVTEWARFAVLFGEEGERIGKALDDAGYHCWSLVRSLNEAVPLAYDKAEAGDSVLLSPACTSWDQYRNYKERGDHFRDLACSLKERPELGVS